MSQDIERKDRRITDRECFDPSFLMGVMYTAIYAAMVFGLLLIDIPDKNVKTADILIGAMTVIQSAIVSFFFGATKSGRDTQQLVAQSKERTDSTLREIVSSAVATPVDVSKPPLVGSVDITAKNASITKAKRRK